MTAGRGYGAFLFDMDGTLIDSIPAAIRVWTRWAERHGVDPAVLLDAMHGVRAIDTIRRFAGPGVDAEAEAVLLTQDEIDDVEGVSALPGAAAFLAGLPSDRWAIVTSAPRALAERRLSAAGLRPPPTLVTAEDVVRGKPAPDGFLLAAEQLEVAIGDCLIWEDSPAGIAAAEASGGDVVVMTATHAHPIDTPHRSLRDYLGVAASPGTEGRLHLSAR